MTRSRVLVVSIVSVFLFSVYLLVSGASRKPVKDPESRPSTFFTDETGARASLLLLQEVLGPRGAQQFKEPLWGLEPSDQGGPSTLIVAAPQVPLLPLEVEELEQWIAEGGQLVLFLENDWMVEDTVPFLARHGISFESRSGEERIVELESSAISLRVERTSSFEGEFQPFMEADSKILAVSKTVEQGRIVLFPDPSVLSNRALGEASNAVWLVRLVQDWGEGTVVFDEFHHGLGARAGFFEQLKSFLTSVWGLPFVHLAVLGLLYVVLNRRRLGRAIHPSTDPRRDPELLVRARASLLRASANRCLAVERLCGELAYQLRDLSGRAANLEKMADNRPQIAQLLRLRQLAREGKLNDKMLVDAVQLVQSIRKDNQFGT